MDLKGWALFYRLASGDKDLIVYRWKDSASIPPKGYYLLGRAGEKLPLPADIEFDQSLNTSDGGLLLRKPDNSPADALGWGKPPKDFYQGSPAPSMENGVSLERKPGGSKGNTTATNQNARDFFLNKQPQPRNTGSLPAPLPEKRLGIRLEAPETIQPGSPLDFTFLASNQTGQTAQKLVATLPFPTSLKISALPDGVTRQEDHLTWSIPELANGETRQLKLSATAPWSYTTLQISGYLYPGR